MLMTATPALLETFPVPRPRADGAPRLSRRLGLAITLLAHLILLLILFLQADQPMESQPAEPGLKTLSAFWVPAPNVAPTVTPAAAPKPRISKPRPPTPVKAKPTPQPPAPVADTRIAAMSPAPTVTTTQAPASAPEETSEPAPEAAATPAASASVAASPAPAAGDVANTRATASPFDSERLERQYARLVSRTISFNQHYPVYSKQFGESGTALVRISLARNGSVLDAVLVTPTGFRYLDDEARNVILRVAKFAPVPALIRQGSEVVVIDQPVRFQLR